MDSAASDGFVLTRLAASAVTWLKIAWLRSRIAVWLCAFAATARRVAVTARMMSAATALRRNHSVLRFWRAEAARNARARAVSSSRLAELLTQVVAASSRVPR